jgi:hypothetical protein
MPSRPQYFHRLTDAIKTFEHYPIEWIERRHVEEVLEISKTVAWRILRRCGAEEGPGKALICRREDFVRALREVLSNPEFEREAHRRKRVEDQVLQLARLAHSRQSQVAQGVAAQELIDSRLASLPPGVDLTRQRLTIEFHGPEDFLQKFGAVVFALQNDYESLAAFLEGSRR